MYCTVVVQLCISGTAHAGAVTKAKAIMLQPQSSLFRKSVVSEPSLSGTFRPELQEQQGDEILLAFSVLGLAAGPATSALGRAPTEERGSFSTASGSGQSMGRKGGWLSSLNTVVAGGDRQERMQQEVVL